MKVTVVAEVEQLKLLILTPSTVTDWQETDAMLVYYAGNVTVRVSVVLT